MFRSRRVETYARNKFPRLIRLMALLDLPRNTSHARYVIITSCLFHGLSHLSTQYPARPSVSVDDVMTSAPSALCPCCVAWWLFYSLGPSPSEYLHALAILHPVNVSRPRPKPPPLAAYWSFMAVPPFRSSVPFFKVADWCLVTACHRRLPCPAVAERIGQRPGGGTCQGPRGPHHPGLDSRHLRARRWAHPERRQLSRLVGGSVACNIAEGRGISIEGSGCFRVTDRTT